MSMTGDEDLEQELPEAIADLEPILKTEEEAEVEAEVTSLTDQKIVQEDIGKDENQEKEDKTGVGASDNVANEEVSEVKLVSLTSLTSSRQSTEEDEECKTDRDYDDTNSFDKFKRHEETTKSHQNNLTSSSTETLSPSVSITANFKEEEETRENLAEEKNRSNLEKDSLVSESALAQQFDKLISTANRSSPIEREELPLAATDDDVLSPKVSPRPEPIPPPTIDSHDDTDTYSQGGQESVLVRANILECEIKLDYEDLKLHDVSNPKLF